jgi:methionine-rich copper-binding protein CopC
MVTDIAPKIDLAPKADLAPKSASKFGASKSLATFAILALFGAAPAWAHAHLESATPAVDGTIRAAPAEVSITFTEKLEEKLSRVVVKDAGGQQVDKGDTRLADSSAKRLVVSLGTLPAGTYTVSWTAASVDTHRTTGSFTFIVKP